MTTAPTSLIPVRTVRALPACTGLLIALLCVLCSSCGDDVPRRSRLELLTAGSSKTWRMVSDSSFTGLASDSCLFDNEYIFDTAGVFINRDLGIRCDTSEAPDLRAHWTLDDDSTTLSFGPGTQLFIARLTDTLMVIDEVSPVTGKAGRRSVFTAQR